MPARCGGAAIFAILGIIIVIIVGGVSFAAAPEKPVLAVLGFDSSFDEGKAGEFVANSIAKKLQRTFRYSIIEADAVAEVARGGDFKVQYNSPLSEIRRFAEEKLGAQVVVWGKVERAGSGFVIHLRALDLRQATDSTILEAVERAADRQELPLACGRLADTLTTKDVTIRREPAKLPPESARPNLVRNGGFEEGTSGPVGWERPDNLTQFWTSGGNPGKCIRMDTDVYDDEVMNWRKQIAAGADPARAPQKTPTKGTKYDTIGGLRGVHYRSDPIPVEPGVTYRVTVDVKGKSAGIFFPKCFVKGYGRVKPEEFAPQDREVFNSYLACRTQTGGKEWERFSRTITPNPHVAVYDFEAVGDAAGGAAVAARLREACRQGGYAVIDYTLQREVIEKSGFTAHFNMPLPELLRFTTHNLHAVTAVWGRVELGANGTILKVRVASARYKRDRPLLDLELAWRSEEQQRVSVREFVSKMRDSVFITEYIRVIPYAYWPPGDYYWDNITITLESTQPRTGPEDTEE